MTTINYSIPQSANVSLVVYNLLGSKVKTLVNNSQAQGEYSVVWNGKDDFGKQVSSGIYFYVLKSTSVSIVKKMILMK
jgi:flagellar hook assembly protein FlgD